MVMGCHHSRDLRSAKMVGIPRLQSLVTPETFVTSFVLLPETSYKPGFRSCVLIEASV